VSGLVHRLKRQLLPSQMTYETGGDCASGEDKESSPMVGTTTVAFSWFLLGLLTQAVSLIPSRVPKFCLSLRKSTWASK
jgi:hypothetical protein